jgi:hypothetical protein
MTNLLCKVRFVVFSNIINYYWKETKPITLLHRHTLKEPESLQILGSGFANPYGVQYICFVDLFHPMMFKRFISWIRFVLRCSKDLFRGFDLWKKENKVQFVSNQNDSSMNPASLVLIKYFSLKFHCLLNL